LLPCCEAELFVTLTAAAADFFITLVPATADFFVTLSAATADLFVKLVDLLEAVPVRQGKNQQKPFTCNQTPH
jgi:hypothetical protein